MARGKQGGRPGARGRKKLKVVTEPPEGTRAVIRVPEGAPVTGMGGPNSTDHVCGDCGYVLIEGQSRDQQIIDVVIKCPGCGAFNDTSGAPELN